MSKPTLHRRLVLAFGIYGFVLALIFGTLIWSSAHLAEDLLVGRFLEIEFNDYLEARALDPGAPLPQNRYLSTTLDPDDLPQGLRSYRDAEDGFYEMAPPVLTESEFHLGIHTLASGERLFMFVDATQIEVLDHSLAFMSWIVLVGVVGVTLIGMALGRSTARRVMAPIVDLADRLRRHDPNTVTDLSQDLPDDEIGLLARTLDASMARTRAFLERERRFTRDASHELRSPVTVVRGAVELLEALPEASRPELRRPIERIRRANDEMARLIEAFLWLAREEALADGGKHQALAAEAEKAVERYRHLLDGKEVDVRLEMDSAATIEAPDGVLGIVLGNLISNAFHFVRQGSVRVVGDGSTFEVLDSGPGIAAERLASVQEAHQRGGESQGFGLGLAIVHDLCERFGWRLEIDSREGEGTRVRVHFAAPEASGSRLPL